MHVFNISCSQTVQSGTYSLHSAKTAIRSGSSVLLNKITNYITYIEKNYLNFLKVNKKII